MEHYGLVVVALAFCIYSIFQTISHNRRERQWAKERFELMKLLASSSLTEYSVSEKRLRGEEKPSEPSYETVFQEEENAQA